MNSLYDKRFEKLKSRAVKAWIGKGKKSFKIKSGGLLGEGKYSSFLKRGGLLSESKNIGESRKRSVSSF